MDMQPLPTRETQAPFVYQIPHAANADGGAVVTPGWSPPLDIFVDRVPYMNATGLAGHATNYVLLALLYLKVIADQAVSNVDITDDELDFSTPHGLYTGDGPLRLTTTGGAPAGLATGTDYFAIRSNDLSVKFATSLDNALRGTAINITTVGTGVHTIIDQATTKRVVASWCTDDDLAGTNSIPAATQMDLTLNHAGARAIPAGTQLDVLVAELGTTTLTAGTVTVEGRFVK